MNTFKPKTKILTGSGRTYFTDINSYKVGKSIARIEPIKIWTDSYIGSELEYHTLGLLNPIHIECYEEIHD